MLLHIHQTRKEPTVQTYCFCAYPLAAADVPSWHAAAAFALHGTSVAACNPASMPIREFGKQLVDDGVKIVMICCEQYTLSLLL